MRRLRARVTSAAWIARRAVPETDEELAMKRTTHRRPRSTPHALLPLVGLVAGLAVAPLAGASDLTERVRLLVDERVAPNGGEIEVVVGEPDARLRLAPCDEMEPFVPTGARLIGRTSLGVRCTKGANWVVYVPVQIKLFVDAWVAARPIARGQPLLPEDARLERIDIAPLNGNALMPDMPLVGRTATRALAPGEPLRRDSLRSPPVVQPGDPVQVVAIGMGFAAQSPGKALTAAAEGQMAQVALPGGKVLSGVAKPGGVVEVR
jgi:flagella basal body P-ring formation protein FlgA